MKYKKGQILIGAKNILKIRNVGETTYDIEFIKTREKSLFKVGEIRIFAQDFADISFKLAPKEAQVLYGDCDEI